MDRVAQPLTIAVTGASGFIGREVVACAQARGHTVLAIVRRTGSEPAEWGAGVTPIVADLLQDDDLSGVLAGADVVIHLAAMMVGDAQTQKRNTVDATKALCAAIVSQPVIPRLVLISSIAVYSADAGVKNGIVDEDSPLESFNKSSNV